MSVSIVFIACFWVLLSSFSHAQYNDIVRVKDEVRKMGVDLGKESLVVLKSNA